MSPAQGTCQRDGSAMPLPDEVHEASGLALGAGGLLWTHGDSGDPLILAVSAQGAPLGSVRVTGARVEDWEDIAAGPCGGGRCLFVGDVGDNDAARARVTVYRIPEPGPDADASAPADALHATYPDGAHDAEAIFVDAAGRIHLVTKGETGGIGLYRYPPAPAPGSTSRLELVRTLESGPVARRERITGASASADGRRVALRTLRSVSIYRTDALVGAATEAGGAHFDLSDAGEAQGEGIALGEGDVIYLASEGGRKKDPATLNRVSCAQAE